MVVRRDACSTCVPCMTTPGLRNAMTGSTISSITARPTSPPPSSRNSGSIKRNDHTGSVPHCVAPISCQASEVRARAASGGTTATTSVATHVTAPTVSPPTTRPPTNRLAISDARSRRNSPSTMTSVNTPGETINMIAPAYPAPPACSDIPRPTSPTVTAITHAITPAGVNSDAAKRRKRTQALGASSGVQPLSQSAADPGPLTRRGPCVAPIAPADPGRPTPSRCPSRPRRAARRARRRGCRRAPCRSSGRRG